MKDSAATVEARRCLGAELAAYRDAAGYSQDQLARLTSYSRSTIANVETGRQRVPRMFWERADAALRTGGVLASGHDDIEATAKRERHAAARSASATRRTLAWQHLADGAPGAITPGELASASADAFPLPSWPTGLEGFAAAGHDANDLGTATGAKPDDMFSPRQASPGDLARLRGMREQFKAIDNSHGGGAALPMAAWYLRREVPSLLDGDQLTRGLAEVVALFRLDLGWMAYDAGQHRLATESFSQALRLAHSAGDRLLTGRILAAMSHQAIDLGQLRQAIDYAQAARRATRHIATPRVIAMLAAMEACAHAAAGDDTSCRQALDAAADAVSEIISGQAEPEGLDFDEGGYWGHAARAYRDLGQPRDAELCAARSVGLCLPNHGRTRGQRYAIRATAHLAMGEADAAAAAAEHVVREAWLLDSSHVLGEVARLANQIEQYQTTTTAVFLDQARELLAARSPAGTTTTE